MARQAGDKPPTFEEALTRLEAIVQAIEEGKIGLQEAIGEYEKGMNLIRHCRTILSEAEARIQQLQVADDDKLTPSPLNPPADPMDAES